MTGSVTRGVAAVGAAILLLGLLAPAHAEGATGGEGTVSPWSGVVGDRISIEVRCFDGEACGNVDWACHRPRTAEVGFRPVGQPWGDPPGYGVSWILAVADPTGRRFQSTVPAIEPGPYSVYLRCDAGEPLQLAGPGFGATDGPYVDFTVIPLVRPGNLAAVWLDACGDPIVDLWISAAPHVTGPDDRRLTRVRIVRQSVAGGEATWPSVAWFRVPSVAPGEYFAYVRLRGEPDCYADRETGSGVSFAPVAVPAAGAGLVVFMDPAPSLVVDGLPDSAAAGPPARGSTAGLLAAAAFLLGAIVSLRRIRRPAGGRAKPPLAPRP